MVAEDIASAFATGLSTAGLLLAARSRTKEPRSKGERSGAMMARAPEGDLNSAPPTRERGRGLIVPVARIPIQSTPNLIGQAATGRARRGA